MFFLISVLIFSCETFNITGNREADLVELHITDIFQEDILALFCDTLRSVAAPSAASLPQINSAEIRGYNYTSSIIYSVLQEMFEESSIRFFMSYSDDDAIQEVMKEIAIIESAEKAYSFSIKKHEEIMANNDTSIKTAEKMFILSFSVKQLLINCEKNIDPLKEQIEQTIEEKKWDMENQEEDNSELFFELIELENGISYLNKIRKTISKNIAEISKIADKTKTYMKQYSD
jgi:hypothetical protein